MKDRESVNLGGLEISATEKETIPVPPIISGIALGAGIVLLFVGRRKS